MAIRCHGEGGVSMFHVWGWWGGWAGTPAIIFIYMTNSNGHACVSSVILSYGMYELALFCPCA